MLCSADIVILGIDDYSARMEKGLYHHPVLLGATGMRRALSQKFTSIAAQRDPDKKPVALCISVPLEADTIHGIEDKLEAAFNEIQNVAVKIGKGRQPLSLFVFGSHTYLLREAGVRLQLFRNIPKQNP